MWYYKRIGYERKANSGLPAYRVLTGPDDAAFCHRVSEALALGYLLCGSPALTFDGKDASGLNSRRNGQAFSVMFDRSSRLPAVRQIASRQ